MYLEVFVILYKTFSIFLFFGPWFCYLHPAPTEIGDRPWRFLNSGTILSRRLFTRQIGECMTNIWQTSMWCSPLESVLAMLTFMGLKHSDTFIGHPTFKLSAFIRPPFFGHRSPFSRCTSFSQEPWTPWSLVRKSQQKASLFLGQGNVPYRYLWSGSGPLLYCSTCPWKLSSSF